MSGELEAALLGELALSPGFVSGEKLARALRVSRATVSRLARRLVEEGYPVEAHPKLGYRLVASDDLSAAARYVGALKASLSFTLCYLESCSSTQEVAAALAEAGAGEGTVVVAEEQTAGRGRLGRSWVSPRGGLWFTVLLRPESLRLSHLLSLTAGVAVARSLRELFGVDAGLKWPNDVLVEGRKVAGILVEGSVEADRIRYALLGVGINVNNDLPPELRGSASSLKEFTGRPLPRVPLLLKVLKELDRAYSSLRSGAVESVLGEWRRLSVTLGKRVKVLSSDGVFEGVALDIDEWGGLLVESRDGGQRVFYAGDIVHLR
ncbi:MAG: biotin--[acetyl-CoA-carboxylase] ligase [Thermofilaceae archaeon]